MKADSPDSALLFLIHSLCLALRLSVQKSGQFDFPLRSITLAIESTGRRPLTD